ncbi:hypothetical protein [Thalassolituus sp.]
MYIRAISRAALLCSTILSFNAFAAGDRVDYDLDNDGLIEINDLADLNEIRNHLDGTALYGDSAGCPEEGCNGFELTTDLDFDTNSDGQMNELDTYWNDGKGWSPIGTQPSTFSGHFDGNGHQIRNLYVQPTYPYTAGLFGHISGKPTQITNIRRLVISGPLNKVTGLRDAGILAGVANYTALDQILVTGVVISLSSQQPSSGSVGGVVGRLMYSTGTNLFSSVDIFGGSERGSLIGDASNSSLSSSIATGYVEREYLDSVNVFRAGSLLGDGNSSTTLNSVYWTNDVSGGAASRYPNSNYFGTSLRQLQCPTSATNTSCLTELTLFNGWDSTTWDFGDSEQLPALVIRGITYRDSDGDGLLDIDDEFPTLFAASQDSDADGFIDTYSWGCDLTCQTESGLILDAFPNSEAAWQDGDLDGLVDAWGSDCDVSCQAQSGLTLDTYPEDSDNDGTPNPDDIDDNDDGVLDADSDSDGLIEIRTVEELNAIRFALDGAGRRINSIGELDTSGCPAAVFQGRMSNRCHGYELVSDINFDTNNDDIINSEDRFWNDGLGWEPIGWWRYKFTGDFDGNGHQIRNLYTNRSGYASLFGFISGTESNPITIKRLAITGPNTSLTGTSYLGLLAGQLEHAYVDQLFLSGTLHSTTSYSESGSLAGKINNAVINNIYSAVNILTPGSRAGFASTMNDTFLSNSLAVGYQDDSASRQRGSVFSGGSNNTFQSLYTAIDTNGLQSDWHFITGFGGSMLTELKCPTVANDTSCITNQVVYENWDDTVWAFGSSQQLPALVINGVTYRDSDGDGVLDQDDAFPYVFAAFDDSDNDGFADSYSLGCDINCQRNSGLALDAFPMIHAAAIDSDLDGQPDAWAPDCDDSCQQVSTLTLDPYLYDYDNDGIADTEDTDDDNNGIEDADADSDGLIEIDNLEELDAIRYSLDGRGQRFNSTDSYDNSGCPIVLLRGVYRKSCRGYELTQDLDFDTNADAQMNESDAYWNGGEGWLPIGNDWDDVFSGSFYGNGYQIRNLYINRRENVGLFRCIYGSYNAPSEIRQLVITGPLTNITGGYTAGPVSGIAKYVILDQIFTTGNIASASLSSKAGGIVGVVDESELLNLFSSADIISPGKRGGLFGESQNNVVSDSLSVGYIGEVQPDIAGGVIGGNSFGSWIDDVHWATDASGAQSSLDAYYQTSYFGAKLDELQCPKSPNNRWCGQEGSLYSGWSTEVWDFGTEQQLPGIKMNNIIYRDSNGDGTLDINSVPSVDLYVSQSGKEVSVITQGMGDVTLEAIIADPDPSDAFTIEWSLQGIYQTIELGQSVTFSSDELVANDYLFGVTITDSGYPRLSASDSLSVRVISDLPPEPDLEHEPVTDDSVEPVSGIDQETNTDSPLPSGQDSSGGGSAFWLLLLSAAPLISWRRQQVRA